MCFWCSSYVVFLVFLLHCLFLFCVFVFAHFLLISFALLGQSKYEGNKQTKKNNLASIYKAFERKAGITIIFLCELIVAEIAFCKSGVSWVERVALYNTLCAAAGLRFIGEEKRFLLNMTGNGWPECIKERQWELSQPEFQMDCSLESERMRGKKGKRSRAA